MKNIYLLILAIVRIKLLHRDVFLQSFKNLIHPFHSLPLLGIGNFSLVFIEPWLLWILFLPLLCDFLHFCLEPLFDRSLPEWSRFIREVADNILRAALRLFCHDSGHEVYFVNPSPESAVCHVLTPAAPDPDWQLSVISAHTFVATEGGSCGDPGSGPQHRATGGHQAAHTCTLPQYRCTVYSAVHCTGERLSDGRLNYLPH